MSNLFPIGSANMLNVAGGRGVTNPVPIIVAQIPLVQINNTIYPYASPAQSFSASSGAIAAGNSFTILPANAGQRWILQILEIQASVAAISEIQDGGVSIGFYSLPLTTQFLPFGQLASPLVSNNVGSALTIKNTSAGAITYTITCFATYLNN